MEENLTKIVSAIRYKKSIDVFKCMKYIPYAVVKGEALSIQAYGKVGQRQGGDIDILIPKEYIVSLECILKQNGLSNKLYHYVIWNKTKSFHYK